MAGVEQRKQTERQPKRLISGPGMLLVWLYGVMVVGAVSRSVYQIATDFGRAPLAYSLSAVAGWSTGSSPTPWCGAGRRPARRRWCAAPPSSWAC
jgi:hypothetical protein